MILGDLSVTCELPHAVMAVQQHVVIILLLFPITHFFLQQVFSLCQPQQHDFKIDVENTLLQPFSQVIIS